MYHDHVKLIPTMQGWLNTQQVLIHHIDETKRKLTQYSTDAEKAYDKNPFGLFMIKTSQQTSERREFPQPHEELL